jgi:hypothetical protein
MSIRDDVLARHGGSWIPSKGSELARLVETTTRRIRRIQSANFVKERAPMEFVLVNNGAFNAFAMVDRDTDIIAMNLGLLLTLNNLFLAMMSHPDVLPKVGDPSLETSLHYDVQKTTVDIYSASAEAKSLAPKDPDRNDYALKLSWIARNFILEHEMCHIFNGHVDWLNQRKKIGALEETGALPTSTLSLINRQTLEMDADCYGATYAVLEIFRNGGPTHTLGNPFMNSYKDAMYAIHFALYATFRLFHNKPLGEIGDLLGNNIHPPAVLRQFIALAAMASRTIDNTDVSRHLDALEHTEIATRAMRGVEAAFLFLSRRAWDSKSAFDDARFPEGISEACLAALNKLQNNWRNLREELQPFRRGARLAE